MRKTLLMLSAALVTVMLAGAASAGPLDKINRFPQGSAANGGGTAGRVATGGVGRVDKVVTGGVGTSASTKAGSLNPTPGPGIPRPKDKVGPITKCPGCTVTDVKPKPPTTVPTPTPTPTPGGGTGGGMGGGKGGGHGGHGHGHGRHHGHYFPGVFAFGAGAAAVAATEYVPVYQAAPAYAEAPSLYAPAPVTPQVAVPAVVNPFDDVIGRLNQLNAALSQGLITQNEYRTQRPAILAALDAGQVSRSIGIQQGLRQLKSMADSGFINGREYDDKRREFALSI